MALELRPLTLGDVLDRAFRLYRSNFVAWITIAAAFAIPEALITVPYTASLSAGKMDPFDALRALGVIMIPAFVAWSLSGCALAIAVAERYLDRQVAPGRAIAFALRRLPQVLVLLVLHSLLAGVGTLVLVVPGVYIWFGLLLAPVVLTVERLGVPAAMKRAWKLARGERGRLFALGLATGTMGLVVIYSFRVAAKLLGFGEAGADVAGRLGSLLQAPFGAAALVIAYFDIRVRKEGFDLEMMAASVAAHSAGAAASQPAPPV